LIGITFIRYTESKKVFFLKLMPKRGAKLFPPQFLKVGRAIDQVIIFIKKLLMFS
jgi:hypothetical protein